MQLEIGKVYNGKVKGITQYGAFVDIEGGGTGMVHISEIANTYVNDIREHLTEEQEVKVKVIGINEAGKVSLSIKKASENGDAQPRQRRFDKGQGKFDKGDKGGEKFDSTRASAALIRAKRIMSVLSAASLLYGSRRSRYLRQR